MTRVKVCFLYFRNLHYAVRATLVSTEALKNRGMYNEAAMQFIKMMSEVCENFLQILGLNIAHIPD